MMDIDISKWTIPKDIRQSQLLRIGCQCILTSFASELDSDTQWVARLGYAWGPCIDFLGGSQSMMSFRTAIHDEFSYSKKFIPGTQVSPFMLQNGFHPLYPEDLKRNEFI